MSHDNVRYVVEDRVATITIDRPERRNAMTHAMNAEFGRLIREASNDDAVHVLVVTGAGGSFCAGTDLSDLDGQSPEEREGTVDRRGSRGSVGGRSHRARNPPCAPSTALRSAWARSSRAMRTSAS